MIASHPETWAVLLVGVPLAVGLIALAAARRLRLLCAWIVPVVMIAASGGLCWSVVCYGPAVYEIGGWGPSLGITWRIDGLAAVMLVTTTLVVTAVSVYAPGYFGGSIDAGDTGEPHHFWPLVYLLWATLNALFLSADVFNLYVTLELLTIGSVGLIVLAGTTESLTAALRYLIWGLMASLFYLMGVALVYAAYGSLDIATVGGQLRGDSLTLVATALMIVGLLVKTALFPMHFWLPPAHAAAPAPISALLSGLVVKASFYLILRLWFEMFAAAGQPAAAQVLGALGACAVLWGSIRALRADRLKMLIAYSTVAQLGYLFLLFPLATAASTRMAWVGAVILAVSHAMAKAAMFLAAGRIRKIAGDDRLDRLTGVGQRVPVAISATALAGVSLIGLPPSGGFAGKWMLLVSGLENGQWWWIIVLVAGGFLTAGYLFRFWKIAISASDSPLTRVPTDWRMELPPLLLAGASVMLMFSATFLDQFLEVEPGLSVIQFAEGGP